MVTPTLGHRGTHSPALQVRKASCETDNIFPGPSMGHWRTLQEVKHALASKSRGTLHHQLELNSVAPSCPTLRDPMDCSTPGFPVHHHLQEPTQTHRRCHPTTSSFSSHLQSFPASGSFQMSQFFTSGGQNIGVSASASVLPMNIQDWFPLGWTGWTSLPFKGLSRVFSNTTVQKHQFWTVLSFLYSPTLTSIHDYWKNHSFDCMDFCWQNYVSAF